MTREELLLKINKWPDFESFCNAIKREKYEVFLKGVEESGAAYAAFSSVSLGAPEKRLVYLTSNELAARRASEDFAFLSDGKSLYLEHSEYMFYDALAKSADVDYRRMEVIKHLADGDFKVLVLSTETFMQFMPNPSLARKGSLRFAAGDIIEPLEFADRLASIGYTRVNTIDGKRQFAVRGDIADVFPTSSENPYRIEFYGDEIDSVRVFDIVTQRTIETVPFVEILADSEQSVGGGADSEGVCARIEAALSEKLETIANENQKRQIETKIRSDIENVRAGMSFPGEDRYIPFFIGRDYSILDYVRDAIIFVEDWNSVLSTAETVIDEHVKICEAIDANTGVLAPLYNLYMTPQEIEASLSNRMCVRLERYSQPEDLEKARNNVFVLDIKSIGDPAGNLRIVDELFARWHESKTDVCLLASSKGKAERLRELVADRAPELPHSIVEGHLCKSFESELLNIAVMGDAGFSQRSGRSRKKSKRESDIETFADIKPGDLVVHDVHGIGRFNGFKSISVEGVLKDYIVVNYAEDGVLYLPSYQLDTIHKFIGQDGVSPKLNTLGGKEWQRSKQRIKDSLREYVQELAELYARRSKINGFPYSKDSVWQTEFEDSFDYEPTGDQLKCVEEIKADMEQPVPMDRLLCGDVGFGKTEVAVRAAFKAVLDGKQVAFLVPTTVLAQQHYYNLLKRFNGYPVNVDYICRFRSPKEREQVLSDVARGKIDIIIGTHSILQKKAVFANLGLIIIDEEQRFGVMQKEKLKMKWPGTDMLTLSATPIPRTLHMSLSGIRDISLLTEPPKSRSPVQTFVMEMNHEVIKNAVYREMARHGQIFYLFNSVQQINEKRIMLTELVPEARIGVAHGQMPERELEAVMNDFVKGEYDLLLCTTIIESGLDLPNANTIIVENGHRLGLAQLYQIRGRVGRSDRRAYAYITYPANYRLSEDADKRLQAIKEFTEFGSGFKIALRDLEIRGAGSVLGEKQHGQLAAVGYDMYCRLLSEIVTEAQGGTVKDDVIINVDFNVSSFIPDEYIADLDTRLDIYRKVALIRDDNDISDLTDELIDRFGGDVPQNVINLMHVSKIRCLAASCGISSIIQHGPEIEFIISSLKEFSDIYTPIRDSIEAKYGKRISLNAGGSKNSVCLKLSSSESCGNAELIVKEIEAFLSDLTAK